ncbi:MAG: arginyltransferase [Sulfuricellaceae bacterium]
MTLLNDLIPQTLQFYLTEPYPCGYVPGRTARSLMVAPNELVDAGVYSQLIHLGFRRSGLYTYRPQCLVCNSCIPVRLDAAGFTPNRTQRRVWKRQLGLTVKPRPLCFDFEHYSLYRRYQAVRHRGGGMDLDDEEQYRRFLLSSNVVTQLVEFREGAALRMVSVIDVLSDGLSSVYTFFDPDMPQASFGVYNILWQTALCHSLGLPYVYLGYWIADSEKMAYKINFQPLQGLIGGKWQPMPKPPATSSDE